MVARGAKPEVRELELYVPLPNTLGGERDWRLNQPVINDLVNKTCVMKPPKPPKGQGSELLGW